MSNISNINGFKITAESASYAATASYALNAGTGVTINNNTNNYLVTATGTAATLDGESNLSFDGSALQVTGSLYVTGSSAIYETDLVQINLYDDSNVSIFEANSAGINIWDTTGVQSIDFENRLIYDSSAFLSIDWTNRIQYDSIASASINWDLRELRDPTFLSIDWQNRTLYDGAGTASIDWQYSVSGDQRSLIDDSGVISLRWNGRRLTDDLDNTSINWSNDPIDGRTLYDSAGNKILCWNPNTNSFFSGSLIGTASWASNAVTSSYVTASNVYGPYGANSVLSASWAPGGAGVTINNNTDNYLVTATGTAATVNGEANLTFDGSTLAVTGNVTATSFTGSLQGIAQTASFVTASNVVGPYGANSVLSASFAVSASWAPGGGGSVTINNNTDNYLVTATGTANTLNGESNLSFDGSALTVTGSVTATAGVYGIQGQVIALTQIMYPFSGF